ncbi:MAG: hypothetical protein ABIP48_03090 [Planctomycetota bacterium]
MTNKIRAYVVCGLLAAAIGLVLPADAHAQMLSPYGSAYYYHSGYLHSPDRGIPYFAAHPPVYYSHIVPRPYGYSPYAYLPGIVTPGHELGGCRGHCGACRLGPGGRGLRAHGPAQERPEKEETVNPASGPDRQAGSTPCSPPPAVLINEYGVSPEASHARDATAIAAD